jgi:hypothetical protein
MMRLMSLVMRPLKPDVAEMIQGGIAFDTVDMTFDTSDLRRRFPQIELTEIADVVDRQRTSAPAPMIAPSIPISLLSPVVASTGPIPAEQRSDEIQAKEPDPRKIIRRWGEFVTEIAPIGAPILLLVRDAAGTHPELRRLLEEMHGALPLPAIFGTV